MPRAFASVVIDAVASLVIDLWVPSTAASTSTGRSAGRCVTRGLALLRSSWWGADRLRVCERWNKVDDHPRVRMPRAGGARLQARHRPHPGVRPGGACAQRVRSARVDRVHFDLDEPPL